MGMIPFFVFAWLFHVGVSAVIVSPVVLLTRKRVHWHAWELLALVLPFSLWMTLMIRNDSAKTLSNLVVEPCILSVVLAVGALARAALSRSLSERSAIVGIVAGVCLIAAGIYFAVPALPE